MDLENLTNEIKDRETAEFGFTGEVDIKEISDNPCFAGCIDIRGGGKISLGYNPEYQKESEGLEHIVKNPFEAAFTALTRHEINHRGGGRFRGCARTIDLHAEKVLGPVAETMQKLGFPNVPVSNDQDLYSYIANMFEDVLDNSEIGNKADHIGTFLNYKDSGEHADDKKFSPLYDAFVRLQQVFYGGKRSRRLLEEHSSGDERVEGAVSNFMERTGLDKFERKVYTRRKKKEMKVFDRKKAMGHCMDEKNWPELAGIMTEEFSKLIDQDKMGQPDYVKKTFVPLGKDGFSDEMKDPETAMKFVWKKYVKGKEDEGEFFEPPAYIECFEALELVYQRLARNLEIKTRTSTRTESMPVTRYGRRPFNPLKDKVSRARVEFRGGRLGLKVKPYEEWEPAEYSERVGTIPAVRFIVRDDSESMQNPVQDDDYGIIMNPWADEKHQWGDNSRYHHTLIAEWGLYELLKKQGALKHTSVKSVSYSSVTRTARNIREAKRQALSPSFGHTTRLDIDTINTLFGRDELVLSISDGEIHDWDEAKDEYIKRARQNHYIHFQIGNFDKDEDGNILNKPRFCEDLEAAGLRVYYDNGKNLGKLVIDLTRPYLTRGGQK